MTWQALGIHLPLPPSAEVTDVCCHIWLSVRVLGTSGLRRRHFTDRAIFLTPYTSFFKREKNKDREGVGSNGLSSLKSAKGAQPCGQQQPHKEADLVGRSVSCSSCPLTDFWSPGSLSPTGLHVDGVMLCVLSPSLPNAAPTASTWSIWLNLASSWLCSNPQWDYAPLALPLPGSWSYLVAFRYYKGASRTFVHML